MNSKQKKQLKKIIKENDVKDNTRMIRKDKKSSKIRKEVDIIQEIKIQEKLDDLTSVEIKHDLKNKCANLYKNYSNLYEKLVKNQIDINILHTFLDELEKIEKGDLNQHEASYNIGVLLKSLYVDKELKVDRDKNESGVSNPEKPARSEKNISYADFLQL